MEKITKREMFEAIKGLAESGALHMVDFNENITDEAVAEFCANEIDLLDKKAAKAKERAAEKRKVGDELSDAVRAVLTHEPATIADIAARIEGEDVTVAKCQYRLGQLAKNGEAVKSEIVIPATETTKARKVVAYALPCDCGCCDVED